MCEGSCACFAASRDIERNDSEGAVRGKGRSRQGCSFPPFTLIMPQRRPHQQLACSYGGTYRADKSRYSQGRNRTTNDGTIAATLYPFATPPHPRNSATADRCGRNTYPQPEATNYTPAVSHLPLCPAFAAGAGRNSKRILSHHSSFSLRSWSLHSTC